MSDGLEWFKSSYSDTEGSNCVEVAVSSEAMRVRDSKLGARSPELEVSGTAWAAFLGLTARS